MSRSYTQIAAEDNRALEMRGAWWRYAIDGIPQCSKCGYHKMISGEWQDSPSDFHSINQCPKCGNNGDSHA